MSFALRVSFHSFCFLWLVTGGSAQQAGQTADNPAEQPRVATPKAYVLHPEDEITIRSLQVKELADKAFRIDQKGEINFPLLGRMSLAGETTRAAEADLTSKASRYYQDPDIAISITAVHEEPVSVVGAVGMPGVHPIHGTTTLLDVLASAGGVRGDAGPVVKVTRDRSIYGPISYPTAQNVGTTMSMVEIDLKSLMNATDSSENILIQPHDVVSVPPADLIYVIGNVKRAGGFPLGGKPHLTVLQALSLAEGLDSRAAASSARILRQESEVSNTSRTDTHVNLSAILKGKAPDILLRPNDILYVPNSTTKLVSQRSIEAAISIGSGILVFKH